MFRTKGVAIGQELASKFNDTPSADIGTVTGRNSFKWYGNVMAAASMILGILTVITLRWLRRWMEVAVLCLDVCGATIDALQRGQMTQSMVDAQSQAKLPHDKLMSNRSQLTTAKIPPMRIQASNFGTQIVQPIKHDAVDLLWERVTAPCLPPLLLITLPTLCFAMACWLMILLFIISTCSIQQQSNEGFSFVWTWSFYVMVIYHSLGLIWAWQMINAFNVMAVAGSVSYYYWHGFATVLPMRRVLVAILKRNCGSAVFGGLFFSPAFLCFKNLFKFLNLSIKFLEGFGQHIPECIASSVDQTLSCTHNVKTYYNKDALILVAIKGKDYCASACLAREWLKANAVLMDTLKVFPDDLLKVGKILVCCICAICSLTMSQLPVYADMSSSVYIASPIFLTVMTTVLSFTMAHTFLQVYTTTWDTLLLNMCEDCECYGGMPRFCPPLLMEAVKKAMELRAQEQRHSQEVNAQQGST